MSVTASEDQVQSHNDRMRSKKRLKWMLLIAIMLGGCFWIFKYYWLEHPVGAGSAGPSVSRAVFDTTWSQRDLLLVGMGDSVTAGLGAQPSSKSYFNRLVSSTDGVGNAVLSGLPRWPSALQIHDAYNSIIADTCADRANVHLVEIRAAFLGHGIYCRQFWNTNYRSDDPTYWYWDNFEDPNNRGYDALRRLFLNVISKVVPTILRAPESPGQR